MAIRGPDGSNKWWAPDRVKKDWSKQHLNWVKRRITLHLIHININHIDIDKDLFIKFPFTPRPCPAPPRPVLSYPALPFVFVFVFVFVFAFVLVYVFVFFLVIPFPLILLINCQKGRTALQYSLKSIRLKPSSLTDTDCMFIRFSIHNRFIPNTL